MIDPEKALATALRRLGKAQAALEKVERMLERSQVEEGSAWLLRAQAARKEGDHLNALMLAGRALGYQGYGRESVKDTAFNKAFPLLLGAVMKDTMAEKSRRKEAREVAEFIDDAPLTCLPLWAGVASASVEAIACSPDGTRLVCACEDSTIMLWDAVTGKELARFKEQSGRVNCLAFSPDGTRFASAPWGGSISIWDTATRKELITLQGHFDGVFGVAFSPDGSRLAVGSRDDAVKLFDTVTGKELLALEGHRFGVLCVAFTSDGSRLASGGWDDTVKVWDSVTGEELITLRGHYECVNCVAFSPDGSLLASGSGTTGRGRDVTIRLWDTTSGKELACLKGHQLNVLCVAFSPDGVSLASADGQGIVQLWDVASAENLARFHAHSEASRGMVFSPDGSRIATGSFDKTVKLWDVKMSQPLGSTRWKGGRAIFSPDGTRLAGCEGKRIKIWDAATGTQLTVLHVQHGDVYRVVFSPDSSLLACEDGDIKLWDTASGRELYSFGAHRGWVHHIDFSPDGRLLSSTSHSSIKVWDTSSGEEVCSLEEGKGPKHCVFSPDSSLLATDGGECVKLRETATFELLFSLEGHKGRMESIVFSPDSCLLACLSSGGITLWDTKTGRGLFSFNDPAGFRGCVVFSPDSSRLIVTSWVWEEECRDSIIVWDTVTGTELNATSADQASAQQWLDARDQELSPDRRCRAKHDGNRIFMAPHPKPALDLAAPLRAGLLSLPGREVEYPKLNQTTGMLHRWQDTLAQLADPHLMPERCAELRMELCTKAGQFRAATALWHRLLQGEWPGFKGTTVPKDQAPPTIPTNSPIRRLYLLALIDATKDPRIHGHPTVCQTATQIVPVLTAEMMELPTISLAMMSLMQALAEDDSLEMTRAREALLKRLMEVAPAAWLAVLRENGQK